MVTLLGVVMVRITIIISLFAIIFTYMTEGIEDRQPYLINSWNLPMQITWYKSLLFIE